MNTKARILTQADLINGTHTAEITDVISASWTFYGNKIGSGTCEIPTNATGANEIARGRFLHVIADDPHINDYAATTTITAFYIQEVAITFSNGQSVYRLSGPDQIAELHWRKIGHDLYHGATQAIHDILDNAPPWSFPSSLSQTIYVPGDNQTVLEALNQAANQLGVRLFSVQADNPPGRQINFGDFSGYSTPLYITDSPDPSNSNHFPLISLQRTTISKPTTTRLHAFGAGIGADRLTLAAANGHVTVPSGYSVYWNESLIVFDDAESAGMPIIESEKAFGNIRPFDDSATAEQDAAIALFNAAILYLQDVNSNDDTLTVETAGKVGLTSPGGPANIYHDSPSYGLIDDAFMVQAVTYSIGGGLPYIRSKLTLSNNRILHTAGNDAIAAVLSSHETQLRSASVPPTGSPSSTAPAANHGDLIGLSDDDHHQYLRADGARNLIGNLVVGDGFTIDGVDLSAHAGDADAHHNWPLLDADIPDTITRDSEVVDAFAAHSGDGDAHHNWPLLDADIPNTIARDTEVVDAIAVHAGDADAHHNWPLSFGDIPSSADPGQAQSILATDSNGELTLARLSVAAITNHLTPGATDTYDLGSSLIRWRKGFISEIDATLFVENAASVIGGWLLIPHASGTLADGITAGTTSIDFGTALSINDFVLLRGGGQVEYMQITGSTGGTVYTVNRNVDGSGANDWPAGSVFAVLGNTGDGRIALDAQTAAPRISILAQGATYNDATEAVRLGELTGWKAGAAGYGLAVGDPASDHLIFDDNGLTIVGDGGSLTNIDGGNIQASSITAVSLNVSDLSAISANLGTITAGNITGATIIAGIGNEVSLDDDGISVLVGASYADRNSYQLRAADGTLYGRLSASTTDGVSIDSQSMSLTLDEVQQQVYIGGAGLYVEGPTIVDEDITSENPSKKIRAYGDLQADTDLRIGQGAIIGRTDTDPTDQEIRLYSGSTLVGQIGNNGSADYLRINQDVAKNIYTPRSIRADGGIQTTTTYQKYASSAWRTGYLYVPLTEKVYIDTAQLTGTNWTGVAVNPLVSGIPTEAKAVVLNVQITPTSAGAALGYGPGAWAGNQRWHLTARGPTSGQAIEVVGAVAVWSNGHIYRTWTAAGGTITYHTYVIGYYI